MTEPRARSVAAVFDSNVNSIGFLRLGLALTVVIIHALPLTGVNRAIGRSNNNVGTLAVEGFFAVSGFLVTRSALCGSSTPRFLLRRLARLMPGYWVALLATALVFAPLSGLLGSGHFAPSQSLRYVSRNALLVVHQDAIGTTLSGVPYSDNWNVPLWTLNFEMASYVAIAVLAAVGALRLSVVGPLVVGTMVTLLLVPVTDDRPLRFFVCFLIGSLAWLCRRWMPASTLTLGGVLSAAAVTYCMGGFTQVGLPCFAYAVVLLAMRPWFPRVGSRVDLSYGTYVYGWPVGQLLVLAGAHGHGFGVFVCLEVGVTLVLAALSWRYVEQPVLLLARRRLGRGGDTGAGLESKRQCSAVTA